MTRAQHHAKGGPAKVLGVAVAASLIVAASSVGIGGRSAAAGGTTRGVTDDSIKVGGIGDQALFGGAELGAQARFEAQNEQGGVNGRTIDFIGLADDKTDPNVDLQEGRRLVQQEEVFAVVPVASVVLQAGDYFADEQVPFFGWGVTAAFCFNPYGFGYSGCITPDEAHWGNSNSTEQVAKALGKPVDEMTYAIIGEDTQSSKSGVESVSVASEKLGTDVVYAEAPLPASPATAGDYTPFVQDLMTSSEGNPPDAILVLTNAPHVGPMTSGLLDAGFEGTIVNYVSYDPRSGATFQGASPYVQFAPFEEADSIPALQEMIDAIEAVDPDAPLTQDTAAGYFAADMFIQALEKTGEDVTVERFHAAANKLTYGIEGVFGPTTFPRAHRQPTVCGALLDDTGSGFEVTAPYDCSSKAVRV